MGPRAVKVVSVGVKEPPKETPGKKLPDGANPAKRPAGCGSSRLSAGQRLKEA